MQNTASLVDIEESQNKAERLKEGYGNLHLLLEKTSSVPLNPQIKNQEALQNSYQQIQKEGIAKISEIIQANLEKSKEPHLNSFINHLISNLNDICKDDQQLQEILDNFDLSYEQINQILNLWEDYREYLLNYLQDKGQTINIDNVNKLIQKLNLQTDQENELEDIDQNYGIIQSDKKARKRNLI
ncbi:hypothetical protein ABPG74_019671 [Tetrahymena malaccensis]